MAFEKLSGLLEQMQLLDVPVPPRLEAAFAYQGFYRFVAFFWSQDNGQLIFDDGQRQGFGYSPAWHSYTEHPRVAPYLAELNFGDPDKTAELYLILDQQTRRAYAGDLLPTMQLLFQQQNQAKPDTTPSTLTHINPTSAETLDSQQLHQAQQATEEMERWLDEEPPT